MSITNRKDLLEALEPILAAANLEAKNVAKVCITPHEVEIDHFVLDPNGNKVIRNGTVARSVKKLEIV